MLRVEQELLNVSLGDMILQGKVQFKVTYPGKVVPEFSENSGKREFQRIKKVCS